jgi:CRISP-associated protein Cas1
MANIYLTEQGSVLKKTGDRLIVEKDKEVLLDVQCSKIEAVLIFGNVQFTTQAVRELFEHGIEMALLTKSGRLIGQLTSPFTKNIELRVEQFKKHDDEYNDSFLL